MLRFDRRAVRGRIFTVVALCSAIIALCLPTDCLSHGISADLGWNTGIDWVGMRSGWRTEQDPTYSVGLYLGGIPPSSADAWLGVRVAIHHASSAPIDPAEDSGAYRDGVTYSMTSVLLTYEPAIYQHRPLTLRAVLAAGPSAFSSKIEGSDDYCDDAFCNLPDFRLSLVPGVCCQLSLCGGLALEARSQFNLLLGDDGDVRPFKSGWRLSLGLSWAFNPQRD
jgi:hypothetical protein